MFFFYYCGQLFEFNLSPNYNTDTWAIGFFARSYKNMINCKGKSAKYLIFL